MVTFPGRMYAFVNFRNPEDARAARVRLDDQQARVPSNRLVNDSCCAKEAADGDAQQAGQANVALLCAAGLHDVHRSGAGYVTLRSLGVSAACLLQSDALASKTSG